MRKSNLYTKYYLGALLAIPLIFLGYFLWLLFSTKPINFYYYGVKWYFLIALLILSGYFFYLFDSVLLNLYFRHITRENRKLKATEILIFIAIHLCPIIILFLYTLFIIWNMWLSLIVLAILIGISLYLAIKKPGLFPM